MMNTLIKDDLEDTSTEKPTFKVNDIGSATWAMRKLKAFDEQDKDFKKTAQDQIDSINAWLKRKLGELLKLHLSLAMIYLKQKKV
ncbi:MAG TPA: hypothetical protein DDW71_09810 [Lactobacillus sp.]|nr:hypothetical protein [Lactobacillus sp.]